MVSIAGLYCAVSSTTVEPELKLLRVGSTRGRCFARLTHFLMWLLNQKTQSYSAVFSAVLNSMSKYCLNNPTSFVALLLIILLIKFHLTFCISALITL